MQPLNKKERRRQRLRQADVDQYLRELARPRRVDEDFNAPLIVGRRLVQVVQIPSFEPLSSWDVRETADGLALFHASGPAGRDKVLSPGYARLDCPTAVLTRFVARLADLRLPVAPPPSNVALLDGARYELAVSQWLWSCRFRWSEDLPTEWSPLASVALEMINAFANLPVIPDPLTGQLDAESDQTTG
jgi:hypothetical protein